MDFASNDLTGKLLIAMPGMSDDRFAQAVIYVCAHSDDGAMGLVINKPADEIKFSDLLEQLDIPIGDAMRDIRIHIGGPVEHGRGFVLHSDDYESETGTMEIGQGKSMTATVDVLRDLAAGGGPLSSFVALGYSGWSPGQLEFELSENAWLTCDARDDIIFGRDPSVKWQTALSVLGIDPLTLSASAGHA